MSTVTVSPITRIEGHLGVHIELEPAELGGVEGQRVVSAQCVGEMFRGLESICKGRDPLDAVQIAQRVCGVCPISHAVAAIRALETIFGVKPTKNGRLLQTLVQAANYLQSHVLHFYQLAALDFVDVLAITEYEGADRTLLTVKRWVNHALETKDAFPAAPFLPRFEGEYVKSGDRNVALLAHYVEALDVRRIAHEMAAVFGGRVPHSTAIVVGGVTQTPTIERVLSYRSRWQRVADFIENVYLNDLKAVAAEFPEYLEIGQGYGNYLCYGVFDQDPAAGGERFIPAGVVLGDKWEALDPAQITQDTTSSWYAAGKATAPAQDETRPDPKQGAAYSWIKAPRYRGQPMEVGPLARMLVNYHNPQSNWVRDALDGLLSDLGLKLEQLNSVLGRHVARGFEAYCLARQIPQWLDQLDIDGPPACDFEIAKAGAAAGLTEAPRGALGHWITTKDYLISGYECIVPTTWNCSPRDAQKAAGPVEKALEGVFVRRADQPLEVGRVIRSFDPCLACAVH